jgi:AcrR family transcriptional regulator
MARRADHTREELQELAIKAGHKLLRTKGLAAFSARKVAAGIGYTVGTLYHLFGSYDNFMFYIHAYTLDDWYATMEEALRKDAGKAPLHALGKAYIAYAQAHKLLWQALFEYHAESDLPEWYQLRLTRFFTLTEQALFPLVNDRHEAHRAARVLWAGIHGICVLALSGKLGLVETESPQALADSLIDNYLAGLGKQ